MRVIKEISNPSFKITLFAWNNRYIIKFENGRLEQTYKVDQFDISSENDLLSMLDEPFLAFVSEQFLKMEEQQHMALSRLAP
ncbi:MAG: hypothetical protein O9302_00925 [Cyclobacteriaceae bacterium]|jgi:hypothetical protein|nr:hypothetical protein [Flammeovirgaceae bacterium]MCZ8022288.1 hypothetical protein [Cytophagales bacterium]MCZ8326593.1 hypothetical protein [Cyclobacteriaceae bacterium]